MTEKQLKTKVYYILNRDKIMARAAAWRAAQGIQPRKRKRKIHNATGELAEKALELLKSWRAAKKPITAAEKRAIDRARKQAKAKRDREYARQAQLEARREAAAAKREREATKAAKAAARAERQAQREREREATAARLEAERKRREAAKAAKEAARAARQREIEKNKAAKEARRAILLAWLDSNKLKCAAQGVGNYVAFLAGREFRAAMRRTGRAGLALEMAAWRSANKRAAGFKLAEKLLELAARADAESYTGAANSNLEQGV